MLAFLGRLVARIVVLAIVSVIGSRVGLVVSGEDPQGAAAGAAVGAGLVMLKWVVGGFRRGASKLRSSTGVGSIVTLTHRPPPGAPWYHHTYVLFDFQGTRRELKLTKKQAKAFAKKYSVGDIGRATYAGERLIDFAGSSSRTVATPGVKVFISYAHGMDEEGQIADYVSQILKSAGLETWVDTTGLRPGAQLREKLIKQIKESQYFVPLLSQEYMISDWCLREFETATKARVAMRPIKITEGRLVPPPWFRKMYEAAGEPVYIDITSRYAVPKLRELAHEMARRR